MSLDTDLHERFNKMTPDVSDRAAGSAGAQMSSRRRTAASRAAAVCVAAVALFAGYSAFSGTNNDAADLRTADTDQVEGDPVEGEGEGPTSDDELPQDPEDQTMQDELLADEGNSVAVDDTELATVNDVEVDPDVAGDDSRAESPPPATPALVSKVVGVEAGDSLNARTGPGAEFQPIFGFSADATGVVQAGAIETADDGGEWMLVYAPPGFGGEWLAGYVNTAFLAETPVPDAQPCMFNGEQDHYIGIDWTNTDGSSNSDARVVSNIETYRFGNCIRTVFEFANDFSFFIGGGERVTTLPTDIIVTRDSPPTIDFGESITGAEKALARFDEVRGVNHSAFASLGADRKLDGLIYGPTNTMDVRFDNVNGRMIIDIADIWLPDDPDPALVERIGANVTPVVDTDELIITNVSSATDKQSWTFTGLARPFEATLGVQVETTDGEPLGVGWIGGVNTDESSENGIMTTTWTEALGQFSFSVTLPDDVDPDSVVIRFDPSGGAADNPRTVDLPLAELLQ